MHVRSSDVTARSVGMAPAAFTVLVSSAVVSCHLLRLSDLVSGHQVWLAVVCFSELSSGLVNCHLDWLSSICFGKLSSGLVN